MSLFTMEQMELIRRLRLTGITGKAVLEAFRELEQVEADLETLTQLTKQQNQNTQQAFATAAKLIFQNNSASLDSRTEIEHKVSTSNLTNGVSHHSHSPSASSMLLQQVSKMFNNGNSSQVLLSNIDTLEAIKAAFFGTQNLKQESISRSESPLKNQQSPKHKNSIDHNNSVLTTVPLASAMSSSPSIDAGKVQSQYSFINDIENVGITLQQKRSNISVHSNGGIHSFLNNSGESDRLLANINHHSTTPTSSSALSFLNTAAGQIVSPLLMQAAVANHQNNNNPFAINSSISPPPSSSSSSGSANGFLNSNNGVFNPNSHFGNLLANSSLEHNGNGVNLNNHGNASTGTCRPIRSQRTPMKDITTLDDPMELEQFMSQGEEGCINDMKQFITQFSLRQTTVAMMTGVSQPYISKLLNGNHKELSLRCRKNIYSWYLNCRRHPAKLGQFTSDPSNRLETNCDGELVPQRRERYVFRPMLIKILETYFLESPFPDTPKRLEIAQACNQALQLEKKSSQLMPKELVSPQVIANWFANKRKEMRRKSNDEPLSASICASNIQQSSPVLNNFSTSMNQLVAVANAAAAFVAANNNQNQKKQQVFTYDENDSPDTRPPSSTFSNLVDDCDEDNKEDDADEINFQACENSIEAQMSTKKNAVEEFLESRTQLFTLPFRLDPLPTAKTALKRSAATSHISSSPQQDPELITENKSVESSKLINNEWSETNQENPLVNGYSQKLWEEFNLNYENTNKRQKKEPKIENSINSN